MNYICWLHQQRARILRYTSVTQDGIGKYQSGTQIRDLNYKTTAFLTVTLLLLTNSAARYQSEHFYNQHWLQWDVSKGSQPAWSGGDEVTLGVTCVTNDWHFPSHLNTSNTLNRFCIVRLEARQTEKTLPFGSLSCSSSSKKTTPLPNSPKTESTGALRNTNGTV